MASASLFPDAGATAATAPASSQGTTIRAESVVEAEPNDGPAEAQAIGANAVVDGTLARHGDAKPADTPKKGKGKTKASLIDADWFRLPAPPAGQVTTIDLRSGPACAELELLDDTGRTVIKRARWWKTARPVLPGIGPEARASLVRVVCNAKPADAAGGPYRLAVWTRPARPDEEVEPNDKPGTMAQLVAFGATTQGTLAPSEDVDVFALDLAAAVPGEALLLSVAGVPDVDMEIQLLDPVTLQPMLTRRPGKGVSMLVPNLDGRRLGVNPLISLRAVSGAAPDASYAMTLHTFLPINCARQSECGALLPSEREPNDERTRALAVQPGTTVTGILDSAGDVDWYELPGRPGGGVAIVRLQGPPGLALTLQLGEGERMLVVRAPAGEALVAGGVQMGALPLALKVAATGPGANPNLVYRMDIQLIDSPDFEVEAGDETRTTGAMAGANLWTPVHVLLPFAADAAHPQPGWQRHGALVPSGDRDAFGLDLRSRPGPTGVQLDCQGDGAPGLQCALLDPQGAELARLRPGSLEHAQTPLVLPPGAYKLVVMADSTRASPQPYAVAILEAPDVLALALAATPTELPEAATR